MPRLAVIPMPVSDASPLVEAYEQGRIDGREAALRELAEDQEHAARSLQGAVQALERAATKLASDRGSEVRLSVRDSARITLTMAEALLGSISKTPEWWIPPRIEEAMALLPDDCEPVVRLSPLDLSLIEASHIPEGVRLIADEDVPDGGCIIDAGPTRIDAGLDSALGRLRALLGEGAS